MKLNKKTIGAFIFAFLVLLLFFSKTIYSYNMPEVTGVRPSRGSLSKLEISSGIANWAETETIYAVCAGAVGRVHVTEGDAVVKNQILFEMDFNVPVAQRRLAETENNINKLEADIRSQSARLNNITEALAASAEEEKTGVNLTGQAGLIALELERAGIILQNTRFAFELGSQSKNDLVNAENSLKAIQYKYEAEADDLRHSIAMKQIDLVNLKLSRETISELLRDYRNNAVIRAPADGIILNLQAERGKFFHENSLLVSIGVGSQFVVECTISLDNNFVNPGDACDIYNSSHAFKGTVQRVRPSINGKTVTVTVESGEINDGETFDVTFEKNSSASFVLVPNSAINQDSDGYFLYQIKRRKGILGDEYYLERLNIYIGDSDHNNTAVVRGVTFFEPVVLVSNRAVSAGSVVSLINAEGFFEN